jgi:hypothetical protein
VVDEEFDPFGGPLRHLQRMAPPWSSQRRTVCGRALDDVGLWVTWDEAAALARKHGRARFAFLMCEVCVSMSTYRAERASLWEEEPAQVVADWAARAGSRGSVRSRRTADADRIRDELRALALLVAAHREEFDALVEAAGSDELRERRQERRRR